MDQKIKGFLDEICLHVNCKRVHKEIQEELCNHIEELKEENIKGGMLAEEALDLAISAMGGTEEIGKSLNRQHKPQIEWSIAILAGLIAAMGTAIMFVSSQFAEGPAVHFPRYVIFSVIGLFVLIGFLYFNYMKLKNIPGIFYALGVLLLGVTMVAGAEVNGLKRWLTFGPFSISAPEFASLLFVIAFAGFAERYRGKNPVHILKLMLLSGFSVCLILVMPDSATAFILTMTYALVLLVAIAKNHFGGRRSAQVGWFALGSGVPVVLLTFHVITNPYLRDPLESLFNAAQDPLGVGYPQHMADVWLGLSNWLGEADVAGLGQGVNITMPGITQEFVLINVIATFGWIAGIALIGLVGAFILRMFTTTIKIKNSFGFYLSLSVCTILSLKFLINILINFNLFPLTGIYMPFVSYFGTGTIINMAFVGIIMSVWHKNNLIPYEGNKLESASEQKIMYFSEGKLIIDFKAWRQ